jgi:hypothetical protein
MFCAEGVWEPWCIMTRGAFICLIEAFYKIGGFVMMDDTTEFVVDEKIQVVIGDYMEKYREKNSITGHDNFGLQVLPVGESWMLYMISYDGEPIASVLHCGEDVITTSYFRDKDKQRFN